MGSAPEASRYVSSPRLTVRSPSTNAPASADQLKQKEILESYITQRVDGIAISALNGDFLTDTINRAIDAGIPVVTWDSDAPKSKRQAFYGVDDMASGRIMGEEAVKMLGGKGSVALDGEVSNSTFAEIFKEAHPDRFFEMYIAEQQLIAAAVGLHARGWNAFGSTFAILPRRHPASRSPRSQPMR